MVPPGHSLRRSRPSAFLLVVATLLAACQSPAPNRDPTGERFPSVLGENLDGEEVALPLADGSPSTVLLVGYVQNAQFDADRWLLGLLQTRTPATILEVPTIPGLFPSLFAGTIDRGMQSGIPSEDWSSVVTLYGSGAGEVKALTGATKPRNIRVFLLDEEGVVRWFHDRGYSAGKLLELDRLVRRRASEAHGATERP